MVDTVVVGLRRMALPDKKYFKIGEVAELVGVEPHVLRYWETQFPQVRPHKARSGHRLYRRRELETLLLIRELLHVQRFTIAGARQALRTGVTSPPIVAPSLEPSREEPRESEELAEVEIEGLSGDDLARALQTQALGGQDVVEMTVHAEPSRPTELPPSRPFAPPFDLAAPRRALIDAALADAYAVVALLDREDAHASAVGRPVRARAG